jgi:hypothetical protein
MLLVFFCLHLHPRIRQQRIVYGICTVIQPGIVIDITPPQLHISLLELLSAGVFATITVGDPGAHGAVVRGTQGMGVNTPKLAAVAAITTGLLREEHIPNVGTLIIGLLSMMVAIGRFPAMVLPSGNTASTPGAAPKVQAIIAPLQTQFPIVFYASS